MVLPMIGVLGHPSDTTGAGGWQDDRRAITIVATSTQTTRPREEPHDVED